MRGSNNNSSIQSGNKVITPGLHRVSHSATAHGWPNLGMGTSEQRFKDKPGYLVEAPTSDRSVAIKA